MVWRDTLYEVDAAAHLYRKASQLDPDLNGEDRIFPRDFRDMSGLANSENSVYLKSPQDWSSFQKSVTVHYYTYAELIRDGVEIGSQSSASIPIISKQVFGKDGKKYQIILTLGGIVKIERFGDPEGTSGH